MRLATYLFLAAALVTSVPAQDAVLVRAARADLGNGSVLAPAAVLVRDGRIAAVGERLEAPAGARIIDHGDAVLTPGLVDAVSYAGLPAGVAENEQAREVTPLYHASEAVDATRSELRRLLERGVTSLVVHPGSRNVIGGVVCHVKPRGTTREQVLVKDHLGLRISLGPDTFSGNRSMRSGPAGFYSRLPLSRMGTIYLIRTAFQEALNYRERRKQDPGSPREAGHEVLLQVLDGALPVFWQARSGKDVRGMLNPIEEFSIPNSVVVDAWEPWEEADELKQRGIPVLFGPLIHPQYHWGGRRDEGRRFRQDGPALLAKAGVRAAFGHGGWKPGETLLDSLRFAVRAGLPRDGSLAWVTSRPAELMGLEKVGVIAVGMDADLVAWSGDPLLPTSHARWVMVDGGVRFEAGQAPVRKTTKETDE